MTPLPEIKSLLAGITKWPWHCDYIYLISEDRHHIARFVKGETRISGPKKKANMEFIAAAPQLVSELVERVEAYREVAIQQYKSEPSDNSDVNLGRRIARESIVDTEAERIIKEKELEKRK